MNDDILLTPTEIADFYEDFWKKHSPNKSGDAEAEYDGELCRAQVRKVVEWMKEHTTQRLVVNADFSNEEFIRVSMTGSDWQALREAAGGEG